MNQQVSLLTHLCFIYTLHRPTKHNSSIRIFYEYEARKNERLIHRKQSPELFLITNYKQSFAFYARRFTSNVLDEKVVIVLKQYLMNLYSIKVPPFVVTRYLYRSVQYVQKQR
jgi:hypothetical protein